MRRDWIGELREVIKVKEISQRTGISQRKLREFYTGKRPFHSGLPEYEKIRNLNRQVAYEQLRKLGASAEVAKKHRRTLFDPYRKEPVTEVVKSIRPEIVPEDKHQLKILGIFRNRQTGEIKIREGYSRAYGTRDKEKQLKEAERTAQYELGSTHWELGVILEKEWTIFRGDKK